jgi:tetratricopeptide (TPR) repeat protein
MNSFATFKLRVSAAQGYVELGLPLEANEELEQIDAEQRDYTEVLAVRVKIYSALEKWELMRTVAKRLALIDPDVPQWTVSWAYATRRADSIEAARLILVNAVERMPDVAIFHYNLACYECRLGNIEGAKSRLQRTFKLDPAFKLKALDDEDLEGLRDSLHQQRGS